MLDEHFVYVSDSTRIEHFKVAIREVLNHNDKVADIGCGSGILGLLCLEAGAKRVYAIDSSRIIEVAKQSYKRAGLDERAVFIKGDSQKISLPEQVDVIICDHLGYFGFDYGIDHFLRDARKRFLRPGGRVIPARIKLQLAIIESGKCYSLATRWNGPDVREEYRWLNDYELNSMRAVSLSREELVSDPVMLGFIDLHADNPDYFSWSVDIRIKRDGFMHGLGGWFESELCEGVTISNSPLDDQSIKRSQIFLPFETPVPVKEDEAVQATVMARPAEDLIGWIAELPESGRRFSHSTWKGSIITDKDIKQTAPTRIPRVSYDGRARLTVLGYCDGRRTAQEIEQAVLRNHPDLFPTPEEISRFVNHVLFRDAD
ncbi:methyltransferase domain-containing protein [Thermodesulfobacteriota bacterium]